VLGLPIADLGDATRSRKSMLANGAAFLVSNLAAYLINIYWVFVPGRHHWLVEVELFYLVLSIFHRQLGDFGANLFAALMIN